MSNSQSVVTPRASAGIGSSKSGTRRLPSRVYIRTPPPPFPIIFYILYDATETVLFYKKDDQTRNQAEEKERQAQPAPPGGY